MCILIFVSGHIPKKAGTEPSELGFYRQKLIDFLQISTYYKPEELLPRFPMNGKNLTECTLRGCVPIPYHINQRSYYLGFL